MIPGEERSKGRPSEEIQTVVVYKKPNGKKHMLAIFDGVVVDEILEPSKRKPLIPSDYDIVDLAIGKSYIEKYKKQYKIK
jgi:hypothetical protein